MMLTETFIDKAVIWLKETIGLDYLEELEEKNEIFFQTEVDSDALWIKIGLPIKMFDDPEE